MLRVGSPVARWYAAEFAVLPQPAKFALNILGFFVYWDHGQFPLLFGPVIEAVITVALTAMLTVAIHVGFPKPVPPIASQKFMRATMANLQYATVVIPNT